ncbi:MAG: family N-acetyltransferase [Micrococcaceae bacterium]|jgi:GNAT superfamily N-acetyltransferase|uniref:GNAT family N-acetyltransferase n=1 Tax=Arthrobacter cheniae TaxID=1258888 RepID=A0A3A5MAH7_9MICC|nr:MULTISPECIES: GNAT family N-acetyltransferase [Arthrobacter]MCU1633446.1 family N-acetyltransferase [Micrococcaceae bacterium]MEC5199717.1 GNAT superfamily N-acetyltransferase [Arthrobacter sp. PL16]RJT79066.1 GNAT family N-acetyltransferase [Arthrobacter cheniae]
MTTIREARPADVPVILQLIHDLALYEREPDAVKNTAESLRNALFGERPSIFAHVAEDHHQVQGFALWFLNYSTWEGVNGIYLEDLYVRPEARGAGHGKALLANLARIAADRGYARVEWSVLDWNGPSIRFYESLGARPQSGWSTFRLTGDALAEVAALR